MIYQAGRCGLIIVSLLYCTCVFPGPIQYRVGDWVVHAQWMVEDIIERRIDQRKRYWRERMKEEQIIIDTSSSDNDETDHFLPPSNEQKHIKCCCM